MLVCFKTNGIYSFKLFSKHHAQSLSESICTASIEDKLLLLMAHHLEEKAFESSSIIDFASLDCGSLFNLSSDPESILVRTPVTYEVCITLCTKWTNQINVGTNLGGVICNLIFDLFNSCPNPNPASSTSASQGTVCSEYVTECYEVTVDEFGDIPDHDGSGDWFNKPNPGSRPNNASNGGNNGPPIVDLSDHLRRIENCEGYFAGEINDTGAHDNPNNEWPDAAFCDQIRCMKETLSFVWEDNDLIAWYLWYDETYGRNTWDQVVSFSCVNPICPLVIL